MNATNSSIYDVAVVGGGPAASAMAFLMQKAGYSTLVLERSGYDRPRIGESLEPSVKPLLRKLGVWDRFLQDNHLPVYAIQTAWGSSRLHSQSFMFNPHGDSWHIDRSRFDAMLLKNASEAGATCLTRARVVDCIQSAGKHWQITYRHDKKIHRLKTRFMIDACGRTSSISRRLNIHKILHDRLVGIAMKYALPANDSVDHVPTIVESVQDGWWYSAPLPDHSVIVVYMTDIDIAVKKKATERIAWQACLRETSYISQLIDIAQATGKLALFPAYSQRVNPGLQDNLLPIGDAFMALDPLSGQGVVHAISNAIASAEVVQDALKGNFRARAEHLNNLDVQFSDYLSNRSEYYRMEKRWKERDFWQRRH